MAKGVYKGFTTEMKLSSNVQVKGINMHSGVAYLATLQKWLKKECIYLIIKHAHANVVSNKDLGKCQRCNMKELNT